MEKNHEALIRLVDGSVTHTCYSVLSDKYKIERSEISIIKISKENAHKLNKEFGVPFGENGISTSKTNHKKYYLCESRKNLSLLKKLEK